MSSTESEPEKIPLPSRSFDIIKGTYYVILPDGKRHDWKIKATHDLPETIQSAIDASDLYQKEMLALEKIENYTESDKMKVSVKATKSLLKMTFEDFDYEKSIKLGISAPKLANIATDVKSFLVDIGGMEELKLSAQRSQVRRST